MTGYINDEAYVGLDDTLMHIGGNDFFLLNVTTDGDLDWQITAGSPGADIGTDLAMDDEGRIYVSLAYSDGFAAGPGTPISAVGNYDGMLALLAPCNFPFLNLNVGWADSTCFGDDVSYEIIDADTTATYTIYANNVQADQQTWNGSNLMLEVGAEYLNVGLNAITFSVLGEGCIEDLVANAQVNQEVLNTPIPSFTLTTDETQVTGISTSTDDYGIAGLQWAVDNQTLMLESDTLTYTLTAGQHEICMIAFNIYGCAADTCETIDISTGINEAFESVLDLKYLGQSQELVWSSELSLDAVLVDLLGREVAHFENVNAINFNDFDNQIYFYKLFKNNLIYATGKVYVK